MRGFGLRRWMVLAGSLVGFGTIWAPGNGGATALDGDATARAAALTLEVDVSERKLYVREGGDVVRTYPVAVGRPGNPTPRGRFRIRHIIWNPRWVPPDADWAKGKKPRAPGDPQNPMGRVKMFFQEPDLYIHGTREVDSLGQAESHGCIRMRNSDVIALAQTVMEHGGARRDPSWFRRVRNRV